VGPPPDGQSTTPRSGTAISRFGTVVAETERTRYRRSMTVVPDPGEAERLMSLADDGTEYDRPRYQQ
jgi:hypothetical protein